MQETLLNAHTGSLKSNVAEWRDEIRPLRLLNHEFHAKACPRTTGKLVR
jgi:hypothetical protein